MSTTTLREDLADEFIWTTIATTRDDDGVILGRQYVYDDGTTRDESYENGIRRTMLQRDDAQDAKNWQSIESYFDENGVISARIELRDSGLELVNIYQEGTISQRTWTDLAPDGSASDLKSWERIDWYYNSDGVIDARVELRDNGVEIVNLYDQGTISQKTWTDRAIDGSPRDVMAWDRIDEYYNSDGLRDARVERYDDGVETVTLYDNGQRMSVISTDVGANGEPSDARIWERIETYYDENDQRTYRIEQRDDGVTITNEYDAGAVVISTRADTSEGGVAKAWDTITSYYAADGQLQAKETVYDNTDVSATFYNEGVRELRLQYDGDDSASWLVRATLYDAAGQVAEVNTYDTPEEVPTDYGFWAWA